MTTEYRAVTNRTDPPTPFNWSFPKPDVNWGSFIHDLYAYEVLWWESREVNKDGSSTAWKRVSNE